MKDGKFFEVIVDHKTGKIAKTEPINGGDDLMAAKAEAEAMAKAKSSLHILAEQGRCGQQWGPGGQRYPQPERGTSCRRGRPGQERSFQQDLVAFGLVRNCVRALSWVRKQDSPEDRKYAPQIADSKSEIRRPSVVLGYPCRE